MSAMTGFSNSGYTASAISFTYQGNELLRNAYTSNLLDDDDFEVLPIEKFKKDGIYIGGYSNVTPRYTVTSNDNFSQIQQGIISSGSFTDSQSSEHNVEVGDRILYNGTVYEVRYVNGQYSLEDVGGIYDYDFDENYYGVAFVKVVDINGYPTRATIDIQNYGYYVDIKAGRCEIANKCYVGGEINILSGTIHNHINGILNNPYTYKVYHEDYDYLKDVTSMPFLFAPTTESLPTSAWTHPDYYVSRHSNYYAVNFVGSRVNASYGFYETSDANLKTFENDVDVDFDILSQIPKKYFTWKNDENKKRQIGTSAQMLLPYYPELVSTTDDGNLTVDYSKLSIIALAAIDKLRKENLELKERLKRIEEKLGL